MPDALVWRQLHWQRPIELLSVVGALRALATDQRSPRIVLEAWADKSGVRYLLGTPAGAMQTSAHRLRAAVPNLEITEPLTPRRPVTAAARLKLSTRHRALRTDTADVAIRQLLGALTAARSGEALVLQLVLGPRRIPMAVGTNSPSSVVRPWYETAWFGNGGTIDSEKRTALRIKVGDHGFAATVRIGAAADKPDRRRNLIHGVYAAIRVSEAPGLRARLTRDSAARLNAAQVPWLWPLRLNATEAVAVTAWPLGDDELPGQPPLHPRQVPPRQLASKGDRLVARALAPGVSGQLGYGVNDALRHTWIIGPNGTGKSTLLLNLICQDLQAGRPVVVIEPKDLITDLLARIPAHRRDDIVVLDCLDSSPVGINPLERHGRSPDVVTDGLLATFTALYGDNIGPRSADILANCLNVLACRDDASLVMLPLLLTNAGFRHSVTQQVMRDDPIAAGPFWRWFDGLSDEARSQVIAPLSNKLRPLLRPNLRAVLAQRHPRFNIREVLNGGKVLLVPLQKGVIGPDTAELLGALVTSELWLALRERAAVPAERRTPVMIYLDEVQDYLRLPTDIADALATSRSLAAGWHLAHQHRSQLSANMQAAFEANARSRICFQLGAGDARAMAAGQKVITPEDFSALPGHHIYASLVRGNNVQPWASGVTVPAPKVCSDERDIRRRSRERYGQPLDAVEADFAALLQEDYGVDSITTGRRPRGHS